MLLELLNYEKITLGNKLLIPVLIRIIFLVKVKPVYAGELQ
jgi:hypothetical protein